MQQTVLGGSPSAQPTLGVSQSVMNMPTQGLGPEQQEVYQIYQKYAPDKLSKVPGILEK